MHIFEPSMMRPNLESLIFDMPESLIFDHRYVRISAFNLGLYSRTLVLELTDVTNLGPLERGHFLIRISPKSFCVDGDVQFHCTVGSCGKCGNLIWKSL